MAIPIRQILHGDCFDIMPKLISDGYVFDAAIADIPYAETRSNWDKEFPLGIMWQMLCKLVKPQGAIVLFCNEPYSSKVRLSAPDWYRYDFKWVKNRATGFANANYRPMRRYEDILVFSQANASAGGKANAMQYYPQGLVPLNKVKRNTSKRKGLITKDNVNCGADNQLMKDSEYTQRFTNYPDNILQFDCEAHYQHPTQKPLGLMRYLVRTFTKKDENVLDFTCGSGTTCLAAFMDGRGYCGIEKDEKWWRMAVRRLSSAAIADSVDLAEQQRFADGLLQELKLEN